jgi:E3 ubiquitin-protein ligase MARCH6
MAEASDLPTIPDEPPPDVMNDPQYATNRTEGEDGAGDADTCRICRGEGSDTEPLFHPCKCSGSIKHVHQDCLMEWLSHSQKKHCELCKTPFRFTKLYSPNMPQSLPPGVFFHHFVLHSARNIATWLRFCLVSTVWLGCLPFIIRQVWRILFWFSDGGWPSEYLGTNTVGNLTTQTMEMARQFELAIMASNGTSPVTPLSAAQTTSASIGGVVDAIVGIFKPLSNAMNVSTSDPLISGFMKSLYYGFGIPGVVIPDEPPFTNTSDPRLRSFMGLSPAIRSMSLLSDVSFLKNLTRNAWLNQLIITIAEGYIITFLVVVCFILVFLIREWVVQQQPGINMGAGFNAEFPGDRLRDQANPEDRQNLAPQPGRPAMDNPPEARDVENRPMARHRRRNLELDLAELPERPGAVDLLNHQNLPIHPENGAGPGQNRPAPVRDALSPATEIQRQLTEEPRMTEEFLAIWRRANGTPEDVLRIIEEESKGEEMRYWVNAMRMILHPPVQIGDSGAQDPIPSGTFAASVPSNSATASTGSLVAQSGSDGGSGTSDSWVDVAKPLSYRKQSPARESTDQSASKNDTAISAMDIGKGKEKEQSKEPLFDPATQLLPGMNFTKWSQGPGHNEHPPTTPLLAATSSRPRAISDGPQLKDSISPLANNNWSFSNLDKENTDPQTTPSRDAPVAGPSTWEFGPKFQPNPAEARTPGSPAWKTAQDLRVQQAIAKAREAVEAQKSLLETSSSGLDGPIDPAPTQVEDVDEGLNGPIEVVGQDGITRTYQNVDEMFAANPVSDSETEEDDLAHHDLEPNPFVLDIPLPPLREPVVQRLPEPQGFLGNVAEFLWGNNGDGQQEDQGANDEHVVHDIAAEAPFVPVAHHDPFDQVEELPDQDREVIEAAIAAGLDPNDPDAIDDAEDFEGIMELIGMRGPIFSLVQNAVFCAFLLALTVAFGVWIPYNIGRVSLLLAANPSPTFKLPLRFVFWCAAFLQDLVVSLIGVISYGSIVAVSLPLKVFFSSGTGAGLAAAALRISHDAVNRILDGTVASLVNFGDAEMFMFSAASHEALLTLKCLVIDALDNIGRNVIYLFIGDYEVTLVGIGEALLGLVMGTCKLLMGLPAFLAKPDTWVISLEVARRSTPLDLELSVWHGTDRFWATIAGYTALCVLGALYVKKGTPFSNGPIGREWEATIIDLLHQAGGVMKVILIISIEMLVFPLYCGLLLDAALLPLFEGATIMSRILFTFKSPLTSIFVHWFVGTCYMFHFALFVSMCRKIMRKGVLCKLILIVTLDSC